MLKQQLQKEIQFLSKQMNKLKQNTTYIINNLEQGNLPDDLYMDIVHQENCICLDYHDKDFLLEITPDIIWLNIYTDQTVKNIPYIIAYGDTEQVPMSVQLRIKVELSQYKHVYYMFLSNIVNELNRIMKLNKNELKEYIHM